MSHLHLPQDSVHLAMLARIIGDKMVSGLPPPCGAVGIDLGWQPDFHCDSKFGCDAEAYYHRRRGLYHAVV